MDEVFELFKVLRKWKLIEQIEKAQVRLTEIATPQQIMERLNDPNENPALLSQLIWTATAMYKSSSGGFEDLEQTLCMLAKYNDSAVRYNACDGLGDLPLTPLVRTTLQGLTFDPISTIRNLAEYYLVLERANELYRRGYEFETI